MAFAIHAVGEKLRARRWPQCPKTPTSNPDPLRGRQAPTTDGRAKLPDEWSSQAQHEVRDRALLWTAAAELRMGADAVKPISAVMGTGFARCLGWSITGVLRAGGSF